MSTVIVVTNFSDAARNALDYTCQFLQHAPTRLLLLNIFSFPHTMASDAIAVAALGETIANDEMKLKQEEAYVRANWPGINITTDMVTGTFFDELQRKVIVEDATTVIIGAAGQYNNLLAWDNNILGAFVDLTVPVLIVPAEMKFQSLQKIAFACNYFRKNLQSATALIRRIVQFTKAQLYIIHVVAPQEVVTAESLANKQALQESLADLNPIYYEPAFAQVIMTIDSFTANEQIDMLLVIPSHHGLWHNIFQKSHTKDLLHLNHIPILSLRQRDEFV
jgi:nucleotide-binding universal stress UspA family protein